METTTQQKHEIRIFKNPATPPAIASKPNPAAEILAPFAETCPIANAICSDIPVRAYEMDELTKTVNSLVVQLVADCGSRTTTPQDIAYISQRLLRKLIKDYKHITPKEIRIAFENGIEGDYGEFFGVNLKTCLDFIKGYCKKRGETISKALLQRDVERIKRENEIWEQNRFKTAGVFKKI